MTIDERRRHELHDGLHEVLGQQKADTLMSLLPPVGWADVATKRDVEVLRTDLVHVQEMLQLQLRTEISSVRTEITELRGELRAGLAEVRTELHQAMRQQVWMIIGALMLAVLVNQLAGHLA